MQANSNESRETATADFRQCILIFTSSLGGAATKRLAEGRLDMASLEFQIAARDLLVSQRVPPEIAGRIRSLLLFRELDVGELLAIVADKIQTCGRAFRLTVRRVSPVLLADLAAQAKSTQFGVRIAEQLVLFTGVGAAREVADRADRRSITAFYLQPLPENRPGRFGGWFMMSLRQPAAIPVSLQMATTGCLGLESSEAPAEAATDVATSCLTAFTTAALAWLATVIPNTS